MGLLGNTASNPQPAAVMARKRGHWSDGIFPDTLMDKNGTKQATADALKKRKAVGVLFSANWSTLCQDFAAHLTSFYNSSQTWRGTNFEIVFVSSDKDKGAFQACLDKMPWLAVSYKDTAATAKLIGFCKVRNIPALVILDGATGEILTTKGCDDVCMAEACSRRPPAVVKSWLSLRHQNSERDLSARARAVSAVLLLVLTAVIQLVMEFNFSHNKITGRFHGS